MFYYLRGKHYQLLERKGRLALFSPSFPLYCRNHVLEQGKGSYDISENKQTKKNIWNEAFTTGGREVSKGKRSSYTACLCHFRFSDNLMFIFVGMNVGLSLRSSFFWLRKAKKIRVLWLYDWSWYGVNNMYCLFTCRWSKVYSVYRACTEPEVIPLKTLSNSGFIFL